MGRPKYWDGTKWTDMAPSAEEFNEHLADLTSHVRYGSASGTNAKTIILNPAPTSLVEGFALSFKNVTANTGATTLNVNSLGAKPIVKSNGSALASGNLKAGSIYTVRYDGANFILQGEGGEYGNVTPADVLVGKTFGTEEGIKIGTLRTPPEIFTNHLLSKRAGRISGNNLYHNKTIGGVTSDGAVAFALHGNGAAMLQKITSSAVTIISTGSQVGSNALAKDNKTCYLFYSNVDPAPLKMVDPVTDVVTSVLDSTGSEILTGLRNYLDCSNDGNLIVYEDSNYNLLLFNRTTKNKTIIISSPGDRMPRTSFVISGDGRYVYYVANITGSKVLKRLDLQSNTSITLATMATNISYIGVAKNNPMRVIVVNSTTLSLVIDTTVTQITTASQFPASISDDGEVVIWGYSSSGNGLRVYARDGLASHVLPFGGPSSNVETFPPLGTNKDGTLTYNVIEGTLYEHNIYIV